MVRDQTKDKTPAELFHSYMRGWRHGASTMAMDKKFIEHDRADIKAEYEKGYKDGYLVVRLVRRKNATRLGAQLSKVFVQDIDALMPSGKTKCVICGAILDAEVSVVAKHAEEVHGISVQGDQDGTPSQS